MFLGPSFIVSTMQEETTPIVKHLWYDWTQQQPGIEPTTPPTRCWVPLTRCWVPPIVAFYDQQGLLRTYLLPWGSIRRPHLGSPRGVKDEIVFQGKHAILSNLQRYQLKFEGRDHTLSEQALQLKHAIVCKQAHVA